MRKNGLQTYVRWLIYFIEITFAYSLEQILNVDLPVQIFIVIPTFISISLLESEWIGFSFGIVTGLLLDGTFGMGIGFCTLTYSILGYIFGIVSNYFIRANVLTCSVFSLVVSFATYIIRKAIILKNFDNWINSFDKNLVFSFCYSVIGFVVIFYVNRAISYKIGGKEENINY